MANVSVTLDSEAVLVAAITLQLAGEASMAESEWHVAATEFDTARILFLAIGEQSNAHECVQAVADCDMAIDRENTLAG